MKKLITTLTLLASLAITGNVLADTTTEPKRNWLGVAADIGAPDGIALGLVVRPFDWTRLTFSGTHNVMAPGFRFGATLDPIKFPVVPTATFEFGHSFEGKLPGLDNAPRFSYDYLNLQAGIEAGNRDNWRVFLRAGLSWLNIDTKDFNSTIKNTDKSIFVADPRLDANFFPSAKLGFACFF